MKKIINPQVLFALLLIAIAPLAATAQVTTYFTDNFSNGSTTNGLSDRGGDPAASYTSYDIGSGKNTVPGTNGVSIAPNDLHMALAAATSSGWWEAQALFVTNSPGATNAIALVQTNDYIDVVVVFTNTASVLAGNTSALNLGLYYSGGGYPTNYPVPGSLAQSGLNGTAGSTNAVGNCASWVGYVGQIMNGGTATRIVTRPRQVGASTSAAQELLFQGNTGNYANPGATVIATTPGSPSFTFTTGGTYTMELRITVVGMNSLSISNILYSGAGTGTTPILVQTNAIATNATFLTAAFDGIAFGALQKNGTVDPIMDISSITITGTNTPVSGPPTIIPQPVAVTVATNGSCAFSVGAIGFNVSYQWMRNGTNLTDSGNISGSKTSMLVITNVGTADELSATNGYSVIVSGAGGFSTNSVTNSLTLIPVTNLFFASGNWDVHNSSSWDSSDSGSQRFVFDFGQPVIFGNNGGGTVTLNGSYLSAASATVSQSFAFLTWAGSGSFAGPGNLIYSGSAQFTINNANTYSGGTIISNASANLRVGNLSGLGSGPVTMALAGASMEIIPAGSATVGIVPDIVVADDCNIQFDALGTFSGVLLGNLSGTAGKTLRLAPIGSNTSTNTRVRVYGISTTNNANLWLDSSNNPALITLAPYHPSGVQVYNGVISGNGSLIQRASGTTFLNGANTYSGGTTPTTGSIGFGIDTSPTVGTVVSGPIGTGPLYIAPEINTANGSGTVFASGGARTIANPIQYPSGTNNQTLVIGGTNDLTFTGPFTLNGNDLVTSNGINARIVQVNNTNGLTTISGVISDLTNGVSAGYGLTKTGSGVLALNNTETYTGPTTVSGGTLQVNGALNAASAVTVTNATLAGTGIVNGPVTITTNGILASGAANIGTLSINNNLTLAGNMKIRVATAPGFPFPPVSNDKVVVSGSLTNAGTGTVTVTNLGPALQGGEILFLFNKPLTNGAALTVTGAGMSWQNNLAVDGTIKALGPFVLVPTNSARITALSLASANVVINGTNGQSGGTYYLLGSTNVAAPLSQWAVMATNIVNTNGASGAFTFTGTNVVTPNGAQQFYILSNTNNH